MLAAKATFCGAADFVNARGAESHVFAADLLLDRTMLCLHSKHF